MQLYLYLDSRFLFKFLFILHTNPVNFPSTSPASLLPTFHIPIHSFGESIKSCIANWGRTDPFPLYQAWARYPGYKLEGTKSNFHYL